MTSYPVFTGSSWIDFVSELLTDCKVKDWDSKNLLASLESARTSLFTLGVADNNYNYP